MSSICLIPTIFLKHPHNITLFAPSQKSPYFLYIPPISYELPARGLLKKPLDQHPLTLIPVPISPISAK